MEFEYELTEREMVAFDQVVNNRMVAMAEVALRGWKYHIVTAIPGVPIAVAVMKCIDLYRENPQLWSDLGTITGAAVVAWTLFAGGRVYKRQLIEKKYDYRDTWLTGQHLAADEAGVTLTSTDSSTRLSWNLVREVIEEPAALYLFFNISQALVLPKRLFRTVEELDQLRRWAKRE